MNAKLLFVDLKSGWKRIVFLALSIVLTLFLSYHYYAVNKKSKSEKHQQSSEVANKTGIKETNDSWIYQNEIIYLDNLEYKSIFSSLGKLFFIEMRKNKYYFDGSKYVLISGMLRDDYFLTALSLSDGSEIFKKHLNYGEDPIQVRNIYPWHDKIIVYGYYQKNAKDPQQQIIVIFDSQGNIINQFQINSRAIAVDESNDYLICEGLKLIELPSGQEKFNTEIKDVLGASTDINGNIYILESIKIDNPTDNVGHYETIVEKYIIAPWIKLWSVKLEKERLSYPYYINYKNGLLYIYYFESRGSNDGMYPTIILDPNNGNTIKKNHRSDVFIFEAVYEGYKYIISQKSNMINVKLSNPSSEK